MEDNNKLDLIIQKLSGIEDKVVNLEGEMVNLKGEMVSLKGEVNKNTKKIVSVEKTVIKRTGELKGTDASILDEVDRVHQILNARTKELENRIR